MSNSNYNQQILTCMVIRPITYTHCAVLQQSFHALPWKTPKTSCRRSEMREDSGAGPAQARCRTSSNGYGYDGTIWQQGARFSCRRRAPPLVSALLGSKLSPTTYGTQKVEIKAVGLAAPIKSGYILRSSSLAIIMITIICHSFSLHIFRSHAPLCPSTVSSRQEACI